MTTLLRRRALPILLLPLTFASAVAAERAGETGAKPAPGLSVPAAPQRQLAAPKPIAVPTPPVLPEVTPPRVAVPAEIPPAPLSALPQRSDQPVAPLSAVPAELLAKDRLTLAFAAGSDALDADSRKTLDMVALRLAARPEERLELRAHAARAGEDETPARRLSLARAKTVREHLMDKGVAQQRLIVFALGSRGEGAPDRVDLAFR